MLLIGLLIALLNFPYGSVSLGDEKDGKKRPASASRSKMEGWIRDLQATAYQQRQQAFLEIWQAGPEVDALLESKPKVKMRLQLPLRNGSFSSANSAKHPMTRAKV